MHDFQPELEAIAERFADYRSRGLKCFATSSFQTNSVALLHVIATVAPEVTVYFVNTGFHFAETLAFRDQLAKDLGITVRSVRSTMPRIHQRDGSGKLLFACDPDRCCHINKVEPLEPAILTHDVWVNGVRASQSATRAAMKVEARGRHGVLRYHPMLQWTPLMVHQYLEQHELPRHPLEAEGYFSVGCQPCTRKLDLESGLDDRGGRWFGMKKTECGLHLGVETEENA